MTAASFRAQGYISLTQLLQQHAENVSDEIAMRQKDFGIWRETTWRQYRDQTHAIAAGLIDLGLRHGDHVGIISENRQEWIVSQLGINSAGAVTCGIYPTSPANEVLHLLQSADCKVVFYEDQEQVDKVLSIREQLPLLEQVIVFDAKGLYHYDKSLWQSLDDLVEHGQVRLIAAPECVTNRLAKQKRLAEDGELLLKGPMVFKGYYKNEAATRESIVNGWLHTGDVAEQYPDGSLTLVDRKKDIIINAAGKNLSPSVIENTIKSSPFIKECIAIGDRRRYVVALIQIDYDTVSTWAERNGLAYTTFKSWPRARK